MRDEVKERLDDIATKLILFSRLTDHLSDESANGKAKINPDTWRSILEGLKRHGQWFEEQALKACSRGERVALFERMAAAFGGPKIDVDWLPANYLKVLMKVKGERVEDGKEEECPAE